MYSSEELAIFRGLHPDSPKTRKSKTWEQGWKRDDRFKLYNVKSDGADGNKWSNRAVVNSLASIWGKSSKYSGHSILWRDDFKLGLFGKYLFSADVDIHGEAGEASTTYDDAQKGWDFNNGKSDRNGLGVITNSFNQLQTGIVERDRLTRESMGVSTAVSENAYLQSKEDVASRLEDPLGEARARRGDDLTRMLWIESERYIQRYINGMNNDYLVKTEHIPNSGENFTKTYQTEKAKKVGEDVQNFTGEFVDFLEGRAGILGGLINTGSRSLVQLGGRLNSGQPTTSTHEALRRH